MKEENLYTFWLSFPKDENLPMGIGVTAYSESDAYSLIDDQGWDWYKEAKEIEVMKNIRLQDLDQNHIVCNMGPMQFRGVWYPCGNIGYGAPKKNVYTKLKS